MSTLRFAVMAIASGVVGTAYGQVSLHSAFGSDSNENFGGSVHRIGDLNGDGRADWVVGAYYAAQQKGRIDVRSGLDKSVLLSSLGEATQDFFGLAVAPAGDVNHDGVPDVIASAVGSDFHGSSSGSVRVISGASGAPLHTFYGDGAGDEFGRAIAGIGDVDGDGSDDVIVGAPGDDNAGSNSGSFRAFSGATGAVLYTLNGNGSNFGYVVAPVGDVNLDGAPDLAIGTYPNGFGTARIRVLDAASGTQHFEKTSTANDGFGRVVAAIEDVDGDGRGDLLAGTPLVASGGGVQVLSGAAGTVLGTFTPALGVNALLGSAVSSAGDFDGNGSPDLVAGAPGAVVNGDVRGQALVLSATTGQVLQTYSGSLANENFGVSVAGIGDVNADGRGDLAIGAPDGGPTLAVRDGVVRVFVGLAPTCPNLSTSVDLNYDGIPDTCQFCQSNLAAGGPGNMHLQVCGTSLVVSGGKATLAISKGTPNGVVFVLASLSNQPTPGFGGTLVPIPVQVVLPAVFDGDGLLRVEIAGGPTAIANVYTQAIAPWPGGPSPYEISGPTKIQLGQ